MPKPSARSSKLVQKLKSKKASIATRLPPLWEGPESDGPEGGVTQSMLGRYVVCGERFRISVIEGLGKPEGFEKALEYGNMWHVCEEHHADKQPWEASLKAYAQKLLGKFPMNKIDVNHWYQTCKTQFPHYVKFWAKHPDMAKRTPLLQEEVFHIPYSLPSGRIVYLKGKFDSVDLVTKGKKSEIWLQENKTKGDVRTEQVERQLTFDLQTMLYIVALIEFKKTYMEDAPPDEGYAKEWDYPIAGVRYNVVRRPFSGGKGSIRKHAAKTTKAGFTPEESDAEFYGRLSDIIGEEPEHWFLRWNVPITKNDVERFKDQFLTPCLENLCSDYAWWVEAYKGGHSPFDIGLSKHVPNNRKHHFRLPFGVYNVLAEGGSTDLDEYLATGNSVGLVRRKTLFPELQES